MNFSSHSQSNPVRSRVLPILAALLLVLLVGLPRVSAQNTISTVAGGGPVNGPATGPYADIPGASSVVVDASGNTYVAVPAAQEVFKVDTAGNLSVFAGVGYSTTNPKQFDGQAATKGSLNFPNGLAIDATGNIYIADTANQLIRKVDTTGIMTTVAGVGTVCTPSTAPCGDGGAPTSAMFNNPYGVAVDTHSNLYIADSGDNRIRKISGGTISTIAGTGVACAKGTIACGDGKAATSALLNNPLGVTVDKGGNVVIADSGDHRIRVVIAGGVIDPLVGNGNICNIQSNTCGDGGKSQLAQLTTPWQIFVDATETLYIADAPENRIRKVTSNFIIGSVAGSGVAGFGGDGGAAKTALLDGPRGVFSDGAGKLYIADSGNQRIREVASNAINTTAGGGLGGDGSAATSGILGADHAVATDAAGDLYIADTANNRIRKVTPGNPPGNITTVVGTGSAGYSGDNNAATQATLNGPDGLALDASGNIYIADTLNGVVRFVNASSGNITTIAGNGQPCVSGSCGDGGQATQANITLPTTVALDGSGNIYIADFAANRVRMVNSAGVISTLVDGNGSICASPTAPCGDGGLAVNAQLNGPFGVAADTAGNVYIADQGDNRVRVVNAGVINAYAFTGAAGDTGDAGAAVAATFSSPQYLAVDAKSNVFINSSQYYVIRRVDAATASITTIAGHIGNPLLYGFGGDGTAANGSYINSFGMTINEATDDLYIADGGNNRVRHVTTTPGANLSSASVTFTTPEPIGVTSPPMSFTDKNTGSDDLIVSSTTVNGDFALVNNFPCTNGNLIAPALKCTFMVTFTPTGYGPRSGKVNINDNAYNYPTQIMYLNGNGPDFTLTASPNSLTIARGSQKTSALTMTPSAGYNQTIGLSCTGAPSGTTCSASPSSVGMDGVNAGTSTLTVSVGSSTAPGSYTLKVTGTSAINHSTNVALTVQ